jgi:hypothetical protein
MLDAHVFDVPMEQRLELVSIVCPHPSNSKGELLDHAIDEIDRVLLSVALVDAKRPDSGAVVNDRVLVPSHLATPPIHEAEELDVDLNLMAWYGLLVADERADAPFALIPGQAIDTVALEHPSQSAG